MRRQARQPTNRRFRHATPSVTEPESFDQRLGAGWLTPSVGRHGAIRFPEYLRAMRSFGLRDSGAVAPSATGSSLKGAHALPHRARCRILGTGDAPRICPKRGRRQSGKCRRDAGYRRISLPRAPAAAPSPAPPSGIAIASHRPLHPPGSARQSRPPRRTCPGSG